MSVYRTIGPLVLSYASIRGYTISHYTSCIFDRMVRYAVERKRVLPYPVYNKRLCQANVVLCVPRLKMSPVSVFMMMLHIRLVYEP